MLVADIHHVSLNVADTAGALAFYHGVLGMPILPRPDFPFGGAWLGVGGGRQVHLIEGTVPPDHGQHVAFHVDDLDALVAVLRSAGYRPPDPKPVADTGIRQTFVRDPDGNLVEFTELAPARSG